MVRGNGREIEKKTEKIETDSQKKRDTQTENKRYYYYPYRAYIITQQAIGSVRGREQNERKKEKEIQLHKERKTEKEGQIERKIGTDRQKKERLTTSLLQQT